VTDPSRVAVLVFRILLFLAAAAALSVAVRVGRSTRGSENGARRYVCPMHPAVTSNVPGQCPICRMDLERVADASQGVSFNASTYQTYDFVRHRGFGQDVHAPASVDRGGEILALVYADEWAALDPTDRGEFSSSADPELRVEVRWAGGRPVTWDRSTFQVRFRASGAGASPPPGAVGWVRLRPKRRELEVIPYSAILESGDGPYVLVAAAEGHAVTKRPIEIGRVIGGQAIVLSGLRVQERILVRSAFFVDAERRLRHEATVELPP
jgi:hypothetical protein